VVRELVRDDASDLPPQRPRSAPCDRDLVRQHARTVGSAPRQWKALVEAEQAMPRRWLILDDYGYMEIYRRSSGCSDSTASATQSSNWSSETERTAARPRGDGSGVPSRTTQIKFNTKCRLLLPARRTACRRRATSYSLCFNGIGAEMSHRGYCRDRPRNRNSPSGSGTEKIGASPSGDHC